MTPNRILRKTRQASKIPVDIAEICFRLGVRLDSFQSLGIEEETAEKMSAATVVKQAEAAILYNSEFPVFERRMAIAKELAYICLYMKPEETCHISLAKVSNRDMENAVCIAFARELLIPQKPFAKMAKKEPFIGGKELTKLSITFLVPCYAVLEKLKTLGLG